MTEKLYGFYVGKELVKKGSRKDREGVDVPWEMWKLKFKKEQESKFAVGLTTFDTEAEKKYNLIAGEPYWVEYDETANEKYPDKPHKNFVKATKTSIDDQEKLQKAVDAVTINLSQYAFLDHLNDFNEFQKVFIQMCPENWRESVNFCVGTYIVSKHKKECEKLINAAKLTIDALKQPKKEQK